MLLLLGIPERAIIFLQYLLEIFHFFGGMYIYFLSNIWESVNIFLEFLPNLCEFIFMGSLNVF